MKSFLVLGLLFSGAARAEIVCRAQTSMGPAKVEIDGRQVTITGAALVQPEVYNVAQYADGHLTTLLTARGLAISFENDYGCIRKARITADFRTTGGAGLIESVAVATCAGGSTPDAVCHVTP